MLLWKSKATTSAVAWEIHEKLDRDVVILILIGSRIKLKMGNTLLLGRIVLATILRMITLTSQNQSTIECLFGCESQWWYCGKKKMILHVSTMCN